MTDIEVLDMALIILFHHALGLTDGVVALADRLRAAGHAVDTPDLYGGATFVTIEDGVAHASEIGFDTVIERGAAAADAIAGPVVVMGASLGVLPAQQVAQTRTDTIGAVLLHACVPADTFGDGWPHELPVQVHAMEADPFFIEDGDIDAARELVAGAADGELFLYPGSAHLFTDDSSPDHDEAATELLLERVTAFVARLAPDEAAAR